MHDKRLQQVQIVGHELAADIGQTKNAEQIALSAFESDQRQVLPATRRHNVAAQRLHATAADLQIRMAFRVLRESCIQLALQLTLWLGSEKSYALHFIALRQSKHGGIRADHSSHALSEILYEVR